MKSVFKIHESIVNDYKSYVSSFIQIKNDTIRDIVESDIELGKLWPEALLRFNPSFEKGESVKSLIDTNVLHSELENVFTGYNLYKHQVDALRLGTENKDFIVTSGTNLCTMGQKKARCCCKDCFEGNKPCNRYKYKEN